MKGEVNTSLTQRVPWICAPQASGGLVLGIPSLVTGRLLERNRKNIHQVHEGSLVAQTRKQEYESLYPMLTVLLLGLLSSLTAQIRHDNPARHNNVMSRFVNKCCEHDKKQRLKSTFERRLLSVGEGNSVSSLCNLWELQDIKLFTSMSTVHFPILLLQFFVTKCLVPYPAFRIHLSFALLQSFLEHFLLSLAAELLLSTDTDTWMPFGHQSFWQISHVIMSRYYAMFMAQHTLARKPGPAMAMGQWCRPENSPVKKRVSIALLWTQRAAIVLL